METKKTAPINFGPYAYSILKHLPGSVVGMFSEFIDNSLASYIKFKHDLETIHGKDFKLIIKIEMINSEFIISDNAAGINDIDFVRALQPAVKPDDVSGLNEFGLGMKYAAVWLSNEWELRTSAIGEKFQKSTLFNYDEVISKQLVSLPIKYTTKDINSHGTTIVLRLLESKHVFRLNKNHIIKKLTSIYRNYIRPSGTIQANAKKFDVDIFVFGEKLIWNEFGFLDAQWYEDRQPIKLDTPSIEWKQVIEKQEITYPFNVIDPITKIQKEVIRKFYVSGFVGILPDGDQAHKNGFVISRRGRVIEGFDERIYPKEISTRSKRAYEYIKLYGELNFEEFDDLNGLDIDFTKSKISISDEIRDDCFQQIALQLKYSTFEEYKGRTFNLIKQARDYRSKFDNRGFTDVKIPDNPIVDSKPLQNQNDQPLIYDVEDNPIPQQQPMLIREHQRKVSFGNEDWIANLIFEENYNSDYLYNIDKDFDNKNVKIILNIRNSKVINNPKFFNDINFINIILILGLSEVKAAISGATEEQLIRIFFNDFFNDL